MKVRVTIRDKRVVEKGVLITLKGDYDKVIKLLNVVDEFAKEKWNWEVK